MNLRKSPLRHQTHAQAAVSSFGGFVVATSASFLLAGCSSLLTPMGENTYDCNRKENPASPYCHSFKSVEAATTGAIPPSRYDETMRLSDIDRMTGIAPVPRTALPDMSGVSSPVTGAQSPSGSGANQFAAAPLAPASSLEGQPVREGPVVQRVWVKRFVDGNDLLVGDTVIYKEIIGSRWLGFGRGEGTSGATTPNASAPKDAAPYPHRATAPSALKLAPIPAGQEAGGVRAAPRPGSAPDFVQPGARAPGAAEMAPVPAASGTTSMPQ